MVKGGPAAGLGAAASVLALATGVLAADVLAAGVLAFDSAAGASLQALMVSKRPHAARVLMTKDMLHL
jgi:hypothetical protein